MNDFWIATVLVVGSPLWLAVALLSAVWFAVWSGLSMLKLPHQIGGPLAILWMIAGAPFLMLYQWPAMATAYLWHEYVDYERLSVSEDGLLISHRKDSRYISWTDVVAVKELKQPSRCIHAILLRDESEVALHYLTDIDCLKKIAISRGIYRARIA